MIEKYEVLRHGLTTAEAGMEVSLNVLYELSAMYPNRELSLSITRLEEAKLWLHESYLTISVGKETMDAQGEAAE